MLRFRYDEGFVSIQLPVAGCLQTKGSACKFDVNHLWPGSPVSHIAVIFFFRFWYFSYEVLTFRQVLSIGWRILRKFVFSSDEESVAILYFMNKGSGFNAFIVFLFLNSRPITNEFKNHLCNSNFSISKFDERKFIR